MGKQFIKATYVIVVLFICCAITLSAKDRTYKNIDMLASMKQGDKAVVVMVYFGTTHSDTRELTINALNKKVAKELAPLEIREAWTSRIVIKKMFERTGEKILNPAQMLEQLKGEGYTHVLLQPANIIEGIEMEAIREEVDGFINKFKDLRVGDPLLYSVDDVKKVASIIGKEYCKESKEYASKGSAVVFVGHGTYTPTTATYSMLEYILHSQRYSNGFLGTVEGHPSIEDVVERVKNYNTKEVTLVPFMFVSGEHAKNDISSEWKELFEANGYKVNVINKGLGELNAIQDIFIDHAIFALKNKPVSILEKKAKYAGK
ncbi:MAG: sirohydrochlorin cobaltochelatase [Bacteroidales bacterium]